MEEKKLRCNVNRCSNNYYAKGYCKFHYDMNRRRGNPLAQILQVRGAARIDSRGNIWCGRCKSYRPRTEHLPKIKNTCRMCKRLDRYKLDRVSYQALLDKQNNKCIICQVLNPDCIDHDHSCCPGPLTCGKCIRGILCRQCNAGLGRFELYLERIIQYIGESHVDYEQ